MKAAAVLVLVLVAGCGRPASDYGCTPTGEAGVRSEMVMVKPLIYRTVKVERHTCTNGQDMWLRVE